MQFDAILTDRKWMKSAKAYRLYFELQTLDPAVILTSQIEQNISLTIGHPSLPLPVELSPCHIVDVPYKSKKFTLVLETNSENQNAVGTLVTPLMGDRFSLLVKEDGSVDGQSKAEPRGSITEQAKKGLHTTFFQNKHFQEYLSGITGLSIDTPQECKSAYKSMLHVESCKDIDQSDYTAALKGFNEWLSKRGSVGRG